MEKDPHRIDSTDGEPAESRSGLPAVGLERLARDLVRIAAEVLFRRGELTHTTPEWVRRNLHLPAALRKRNQG